MDPVHVTVVGATYRDHGGRERLPREPAGQMRESGGSSTGHNRETTSRANDYPSTEGHSPAPPPLTDHTKGRTPAPPPLTDHTKGRTPAPPPLTDHTKGRTPAPPPLTDHTKGRSPAPPPLTDHTKGRSPAPPHPPEGASKARQIEPVSLPGQGPPAAG
jgi:hypothetical protein